MFNIILISLKKVAMTCLDILIAGAGISGLALAHWLALSGCNVTIVERTSDLRADGQQLDITGQGIVIMKKMGIEDAVRAALCPETGSRLIDQEGKSIAFFPARKDVTRGTKEYEIMRGDLVRILYDKTKGLARVKYNFGTNIQSFTQDDETPGGKVHVTFSDGKQAGYDVLIGADGIGSTTRRQMLGPSFPDPHHDMGFHIAYFTAPPSASDTTDWTWCLIPGGKVVMTRKDSPENIRVYLMMPAKDCAALDVAKNCAEQKAALLEIFKDINGAQLDRFLRDLKDSPMSDDLYSQHLTQIRLPEGAWSRGRVVLTGDAAYCASVGGNATTFAIVGAYILAGEIMKKWKESQYSLAKFNIEKAAKEYERIVRPLVKSSGFMPSWAQNTLVKVMGTRIGIRTLQKMIQLVGALQVDKFLSKSEDLGQSEKLQYEEYF